MFGATIPPENGGYLLTENSDTNTSDRYCIHHTHCTHYKKSKISGNTVNFETPSLEEMKIYLESQQILPGGIKCCGTCLKQK